MWITKLRCTYEYEFFFSLSDMILFSNFISRVCQSDFSLQQVLSLYCFELVIFTIVIASQTIFMGDFFVLMHHDT